MEAQVSLPQAASTRLQASYEARLAWSGSMLHVADMTSRPVCSKPAGCLQAGSKQAQRNMPLEIFALYVPCISHVRGLGTVVLGTAAGQTSRHTGLPALSNCCMGSHLLPGLWMGRRLCPDFRTAVRVSSEHLASAGSMNTCSSHVEQSGLWASGAPCRPEAPVALPRV